MTTYASDIAARAASLDLQPGRQAQRAGRCLACGKPHDIGDPIIDFAPAPTFVDYASLKGDGQLTICPPCHAIWDGKFTSVWATSVITEAGVFKANSNAQRAYWLLNPPEGKWVFMVKTAMRQHIVWFAKVNTSRDLFHVQMGNTPLLIRRRKLPLAMAAWHALVDAMNANRGRGSRVKKSPFTSLDRDYVGSLNGTLNPILTEISRTDPAVANHLSLMNSLTSGELWALTSLIYAEPASGPESYLEKETQK